MNDIIELFKLKFKFRSNELVSLNYLSSNRLKSNLKLKFLFNQI